MKFIKTNFSDVVLRFIYGDDVDTEAIRNIKTHNEIWDDIILNLANGDITKIKDIKQMPFIDVFNILKSKLKPIPRIKLKKTDIGFNINNNDKVGE